MAVDGWTDYATEFLRRIMSATFVVFVSDSDLE